MSTEKYINQIDFLKNSNSKIRNENIELRKRIIELEDQVSNAKNVQYDSALNDIIESFCTMEITKKPELVIMFWFVISHLRKQNGSKIKQLNVKNFTENIIDSAIKDFFKSNPDYDSKYLRILSSTLKGKIMIALNSGDVIQWRKD